MQKQAVVIGFLLLHCFIEQICSCCLSEHGLPLTLSTNKPTTLIAWETKSTWAEVRATCSMKMIGQNGLRLVRIAAATQLYRGEYRGLNSGFTYKYESMIFELFVKVRL